MYQLSVLLSNPRLLHENVCLLSLPVYIVNIGGDNEIGRSVRRCVRRSVCVCVSVSAVLACNICGAWPHVEHGSVSL